MHRPSGFAHLELPIPALPIRQATSIEIRDDDFCLPVATTANTAASVPAASRPQARATHETPVLLDSLDDGEDDDAGFLLSRGTLRVHREIPSFVPFQLEVFAAAKNPWSVNSVADLFRLFLPELSACIALMAGCGFMAGKLLARWADDVRPPWIAALYLVILTLHLSVVYLGGKGNNSSRLQASLRTLVLGLFLLLIPHMVAFLVLRMGA
ncbi:MAG TPA: hypothetical protein VGE67_15445 [Haloferula sp.]